MNIPDQSARTTHFEKTIEWYYVAHYLQGKFGSPLAGLHEKVGDALISDGTKLIIIEFKRTYKELESEKKKYPSTNLSEGKPSQENINAFVAYRFFRDLFLNVHNHRNNTTSPPNFSEAPHAFVYGNYATNDPISQSLLGLTASKYWGEWANGHYFLPTNEDPLPSGDKKPKELCNLEVNMNNLVAQLGWSGKSFKKYVDDVVKAKNGYSEAAKEDWMYATVAGIVPTVDGDRAVAMSLWEYAHATGMDELCNAFAKYDLQCAQKNANSTQDNTQPNIVHVAPVTDKKKVTEPPAPSPPSPRRRARP